MLDDVVNIENLNKNFGHKKVLKDISFTLKKGDSLGLFGPNGAGKTTLLKILSTLSKPSSGNIKISGFTPYEHEQELRKSIGIISHETFIYNNLTALENLIFYGRLYDVENVEKKAIALLTEMNLFDRRNDIVRTFSRGMQQRLTIARALIHNPEIIFLDEPYTGLDQHATQLLSDLLTRLYEEKRTIILITHDLSIGYNVSNILSILVKGKIVFWENRQNITKDEFIKIYHEKADKAEF